MSSNSTKENNTKPSPPPKRSWADGLVKPNRLITAPIVPTLFLASIPLTTFLSSITPKILPTLSIPALSTIYISCIYVASATGSASGIGAGLESGRDNRQPHANVAELKGLPARLFQANVHLMGHLPAFAVMAVLAQSMGPGKGVVLSLLGLHVGLKVGVWYPAYVFDFHVVRSIAHIIAMGCLINVGLRLSKMS